MGGSFFAEVTGPIPFGGLGSTDPLSFKVYEPDRLVLGKRMEDHLRIARLLLALVQLAGLRRVRDAARSTGPGSTRAAIRCAAAGPSWTPRSSSSTKLGVPYYCFHDRDMAPEGRDVRRDAGPTSTAIDRCRRGAHGADRRQAAVGHGEPVQPPALRGRRGHEPRPRGVRLRGRPGQAHARGDAAPRRGELRPVGRPRGLRDAAEHRPRPRGAAVRPVPHDGRRAQAPDRLRGAAPDRAEAAGADQAPVRLRRRDRPRLPRPPRPRGRVPGEPRGQPRHAGRPQLPSRGRLRDRQRDLRQHRREPRRLPERLGHGPVPELGRRAVARRLRDPARRRVHDRAASTSTRSCAARAWIGPTCSMPTSAGSTRSRGRSSSRRT